MPTRAELKEEAKKRVDGKLGVTFLPLLINIVLCAALDGLSYYIYFTWIFTTLCGFMYNMWNMHFLKTDETSLDNYFSSLKSVDRDVKVVLTELLSAVFIALWSILLIVPGTIKAFSYAMVPYILCDKKDCAYMDCLRLSEDMMKGHKWEYFVLILSFIGWYILCGLTCGILLYWKGAYMNLTFILYYQHLKIVYEQSNPGTFEDLYDAPVVSEDDSNIIDGEIFSK